MLYYLWLLHYSLAKRIYRKRHKAVKETAWTLAFGCIFLLILFIMVLLMNKGTLRAAINSGITIAPIAGFIVVIILMPILLFVTGIANNKKLRILRKVVKQTQNVKYLFSVLYVCFYILLFLMTILIIIKSLG